MGGQSSQGSAGAGAQARPVVARRGRRRAQVGPGPGQGHMGTFPDENSGEAALTMGS